MDTKGDGKVTFEGFRYFVAQALKAKSELIIC
jgi:hypothetical protein